MKILQVNKFFYRRGGAETYFFNLINLLQEKGHQIFTFSQKNEKNLPSPESGYFIEDLELGRFSWATLFRLPRIFWSFSASKQIKTLLADKQPELVHLHNIYHQISPSILPVIKRAGLPIVMTVHDFKLIKPDYTLRADNEKINTKKSTLIGYLLSWEFNFHKLIGVYRKNIDLFLAPSQFVKDRLVAAGYDQKKIIVLPHLIDLKNYPANTCQPEDYLLFFGRLDESKGADLVISAISQLPQVKLKIAGTGPQLAELKNLVASLKISERVEFVGQQSGRQLIELIQKSQFTVFPSRVHETFGLSVLESFACGKPVVAAKVGGVPEIVEAGRTGLLFAVNDLNGLKTAIADLLSQPEKIKTMGDQASAVVKEKYSAETHYQKLSSIYQGLKK